MVVFDTDIASLHQRQHPNLLVRLQQTPFEQLAITIVSYQEQVAGRLAVIKRAKNSQQREFGYLFLQKTLDYYCQMQLLQMDERATLIFETLQASKLRVGTHDLLIASIAIANRATLVTRNLRDFQRVPNLMVEDWSQPI